MSTTNVLSTDVLSWCSVGVDVGGTTTRVVAFGPDGKVLAQSVRSTSSGSVALLATVTDAVREVASHAGPVRHVGVGIPGQVAPDGSVAMALNVGITARLPLADQLSEILGVPVVVENDVNAAALGSLGTGASLAYLSIGTGLAVGSIIDGVIVRGSYGGAGEIGHLPLAGEDIACGCGQRGCIETVASGRALSNAALALGLGTLDRTPTAVDLWDAADAGLAGAIHARDRAIAAISWACQAAVLMLDVEQVVLGGGVSELGTRLSDSVVDALVARERVSPWLAAVGPSRRIRLAPAGVHLGAIGADLSARQRLHV